MALSASIGERLADWGGRCQAGAGRCQAAVVIHMSHSVPESIESSPSAPSVNKSGERVREMFGEIAPKYDRMNHLLSLHVDRYWRWRTVRLLGPQPGQRILDVCTGTGDLALAFSRFVKGQATIIGADFCPEMLEIGRAKTKRLKADNIKFVEADAQQLPMNADTFDLVTVAFGLRNVEDTDRGLREMARVCKPGGQVGVLEFSEPRRWPIRGLYGWYFRNVLPKIGNRLSKNQNQAYQYLPQSVGTFAAYEELAAQMEQAGLNSVRFHPLTFGIATLYVGRK